MPAAFSGAVVVTQRMPQFRATSRDSFTGRFVRGKSTRMRRDASSGRFTGLSDEALAFRLDIQVRLDAQLDQQLRQVAEHLEKNAIYSLKGAAYAITQQAKASIVATRSTGAAKGGKGRSRASRPGTPPYTRGIPRKNLRAAIAYEVDKERMSAFIGPRHSVVADASEVHEYGGRRHGKMGSATYPARPFMQPALEKQLPRIPQKFRSLVGPGT